MLLETKIEDLLDAYPDTAICFGKAAMTQLAVYLNAENTRKVALFTGGSSAKKSGALMAFVDVLKQGGDIGIVSFREVEPEPSIDTVRRMTEFLYREQPDQVVAIGGGSPLDAAKAAWLIHQAGGVIDDYFGVNRFSSINPGRKLKKIIAIPTTSGTGSEATPYSNIVDREQQVKKLISEREIIPEYSFVVPEFAATMPPSFTLATGCDALAHAIEGFLNIGADNAHPQANTWAFEAIRLIVGNLHAAVQDGQNMKARTAMSAAATLAGMVICYKPTGLPHLCSFSWFGRIEHGLAVALILPAAWRYYIGSEAVASRTMELAPVFGGSTPEEVIAGYRAFLNRCGVPDGLRHYSDIDQALLDRTAESAGQNKMKLDSAPRPVALEDSRNILSGILKEAW